MTLVEWETWDDIRAGAEIAGFPVSRDQLERWRGIGLLPKVKQVGLGRAAGSEVRYPVGTTDQVVAIAEAFLIRRKKDFVGWRLWLQGFDVDGRYWRDHIDAGHLALNHAQQWMRDILHKDDSSDETEFDRLAPELFSSPIFRGVRRSLPDGMAPYLIAVLGDIIAGQFQGFSPKGDIEEFGWHRSAFTSVMGIPRTGKSTIISKYLEISAELEIQLVCISNAVRQILGNPGVISEYMNADVRREFWLSTKIIISLHNVLSKQERSPFRIGNKILEALHIQASMLIIWSVFRCQGSIKSSAEIGQIAHMAGVVQATFSMKR